MFYAPTVDEGIKTIIYPFQGIERIYERGTLDQVIGRVVELQGKKDVFNEHPERNKYGIVVVWSEGKDLHHDWFLYWGIEEWPENPSVDNYYFKNGVFQPRERHITCGDSLIMLGIEEQHRRTTKSRAEYLRIRPDLPTPLRVGEVF